MRLFFEHIWIIWLLVTVGNAFLLKYNSKEYVSKNPDLEIGYKTLFVYLIFYINVPWIIMAIGDLTGSTNGRFDYINFNFSNPFVFLFYFSILVLLILIARWIYFKNGAKFLEQHPGLSSITNIGKTFYLSEMQIKVIYGITVLFSIASILVLWFKHK